MNIKTISEVSYQGITISLPTPIEIDIDMIEENFYVLDGLEWCLYLVWMSVVQDEINQRLDKNKN